jgi:hypothetical protein
MLDRIEQQAAQGGEDGEQEGDRGYEEWEGRKKDATFLVQCSQQDRVESQIVCRKPLARGRDQLECAKGRPVL